METPKTLKKAVEYFADPDNALQYFAAYRWPKGVECPYCQAKEPMFLKTRRIWKCRATKCRKQFSVKVGTIFNESPISLDKWLMGIWLISNCKNGVSSYELARDIGVSQKTAWFMLSRIRLAMQDENGGKLSGEVEADESFIGGKRGTCTPKTERDAFADVARTVKLSLPPFWSAVDVSERRW